MNSSIQTARLSFRDFTVNDYDAVVMGVLEPILVLSVMAVIAFLVRLSW